MEGTKERHCLRCLLEEIDPKAYARDIQRILDHMEPGERAGEDIRKGTACGCFVELRAALRTGHCPYRKWESGSRKREKG